MLESVAASTTPCPMGEDKEGCRRPMWSGYRVNGRGTSVGVKIRHVQQSLSTLKMVNVGVGRRLTLVTLAKVTGINVTHRNASLGPHIEPWVPREHTPDTHCTYLQRIMA